MLKVQTGLGDRKGLNAEARFRLKLKQVVISHPNCGQLEKHSKQDAGRAHSALNDGNIG